MSQAQAPDFSHALSNPRLMEAALALAENRLHDAEPLLKGQLKQDPYDVAAMRMLAELAGRIGRYQDSEKLLRRALELAPGFAAARSNLATVLYRQNRPADAIAELDQLLTGDPDDPASANLKAAALGRIGEYQEAVGLYEQVLAKVPGQPKIWMSYGHILKTVGRQADSIAAYRRGLEIEPGLGEIWWSLANLKTMRFADEDLAAMNAALEGGRISGEDRFHLHFALGKAHEDRGEAERAFRHYAEGNRLRRALIDYDADEVSASVDTLIAAFTPALVARLGDSGEPAGDPIFILGMPRAGSTLIEQILSSHSLIEGTMELPDMPLIGRRIEQRHGGLAGLTPDLCRQLGAEYLERTRIQRKTGKPFFIDKLPNNWLHAGLIRLILPNARIIDARRHPLGCCFSNFKQHFARGQGFSYSLEEVGRFYADYVRAMAHLDVVIPGHVHRVHYEAMVDDTEGQVRALLAHLGLPFEAACLRFFESDRAVRTASSEQVRRPIYREGTEAWQPFEPWLDPLKAALGPVLASYPAVPPNFGG